ncbi:30S ribosome-binding factor RbfA [Rhodoferax sp. 4810]|uniref:Ribosome-binding factor A n=1 Tax=Thiospirillum jenense TaxID=1653858 RepID=A0A839HGT2_9GAMM|nr:30S ribosome-binding factor RbfA [Rhodoferax jenense]MBB1125482.1 30S ribosome-binding factor RbfA [Thiospirillum jenense]
MTTNYHAKRRAPNNTRYERVGAELLRALTLILRDTVKDPRLDSITVHEVRVSRDLAYAKVFFTCFTDSHSPVDTSAGLEATQQAQQHHQTQQRLLNGSLAGFLRQALSRAVQLRVMPELHFVYDDSIRQGEYLAALIENAQPVHSVDELDDSHTA